MKTVGIILREFAAEFRQIPIYDPESMMNDKYSKKLFSYYIKTL